MLQVPLRIRNAYQQHPNGFSSYYPETPQSDYVTYKGGFNFHQKPVNFNVPIKEFDYASLKRKPIVVAPLETSHYWHNQQPSNQVYQQQQTSQQYNQYQQTPQQTYQQYNQQTPQQYQQTYQQYNQQTPQQYQQTPQQYNQQTPQQYNQQTPQQYNQQTPQQVAPTQQYPVQNKSSQVQRHAPASNVSTQTPSAADQQKIYEDFSSQKIQKQANYPSQKKKAVYTKGQYQTEHSESEKKPTSVYPKKAMSEQTASKYTYYVKQN
ncbi:probable basic-leucine zipper transcription factor N [Nilaparvata lugens]|uniref:probable basic-leucine zipper transcription factor N n=1 Tax=Nilaparvata lugens TaxID=108931 RepID=UPI00193D05DD|nr:probable basic-leucine zipper transcription factor N [Nilaparvata lugens]